MNNKLKISNMQRNWITLYFLIIFWHLPLIVTSESYYSINAPGVIKSNRKYTVVVSLHESSGPCMIRVGINGTSFNDSQDVNLQPYESKLLEFLPKKLVRGDYLLWAEGLSGIRFKNASRIINFYYYGPKIYIQTDKAVYKPEDVVNFRVVVLDEHTRPLTIEDPVWVDILDSEDNRVKQFKDVTLTKGVYTGKFQLSKYPTLGTWKIKAILGGKYEYSSYKSIMIKDYVLPKFGVYIKTPTNLIVEDGAITVVLYGKYVFDKYVEGNATVELWNDDGVLLQTKTLDLENRGFVQFNTNNENFNNIESLKIKAQLTEKYTGRTESEQQDIMLRKQRYNLEYPYEEIEFANNKPYRLRVYVKHWTGAAVFDRNTPVTMDHGGKMYEAYLNENGAATFEFEHDVDSDHKFQFKNSRGRLYNIYTSSNLMLNNTEYYCRLVLLDKSLKLGKSVQIEVSSIDYIPYLMYTIMGHASLTRTEHIKVPSNQKSHVISITPHIDMIPTSFIYVYYVHKGNLYYEEMVLSFPEEFENQISLSAPKQVKPGSDISIDITAQPKSYVSILAVDLGVYLLDPSYDLKKKDILDELIAEVSYIPLSASKYPGLLSGVVTLTNAHYPYEHYPDSVIGGPRIPTLYRFRKKFPETWIFDNFLVNETNSKLTLPIPDTITTWRITAFTNNDITGFGIVNGPTDITTIQTFFVSINLPYSIKRGEIISIPITIYNYHNQSLDAEVILYNSDQEFYFMESSIQDIEKSNVDPQQSKIINIPAENVRTLNFLIYPIRVGEISLRVTATTTAFSDAVLHKLKVEPDGVVKQKNQALYLSIPQGEKITSSFKIMESMDSVPGSNYITFTVGGHYLVPTIENFQDLIQIPTGSGEQNMVNFAPSVLLLQYLKANGKLTQEKDLVQSLNTSMEVAYQQQLSFRHNNGGYSVFGMGTDEEPNTWLTAYVVRYFIKSLQFLEIEEKIIEAALKYLAAQQKSNGEFPFTGYLLKSNHKNEYGLTAFILLAFLENEKYASAYQGTIQSGVQFLNSNIDNIDDLYTLSLAAVVMKRVKHPKSNSLITQLKSQVKEENDLKWWSGDDQNLSNDIEITSYAALTLLDTAGDHTSILKWLVDQRNANGGFQSSSDTVAGMEALVKFSEKYQNINKVNLKISYSAQDQQGIEVDRGEFLVNSNNLLDSQKHELPETTHSVTFDIEGNGASLVQLNHQYNIDYEEAFRHFNIMAKPIHKNPEQLNLEICFTYQSEADTNNDVTNMVIMEANLPSGYVGQMENPILSKEKGLVRKVEMKNSESTIILYMNNLEENTKHCLDVPADKTNEILLPKPAAIIMYDYYNLSRSSTEFYSL